MQDLQETFTTALAHSEPILISVISGIRSCVQFIGACANFVGCHFDPLPLISPLAAFIERFPFNAPEDMCQFNWPI